MRYASGGSLVPRGEPGAVLDADARGAAGAGDRRDGVVEACSICIHGDSPGRRRGRRGFADELERPASSCGRSRDGDPLPHAGERGALLELADNEAAVRVAVALRRVEELVDVVPCTPHGARDMALAPPARELLAVAEAALRRRVRR